MFDEEPEDDSFDAVIRNYAAACMHGNAASMREGYIKLRDMCERPARGIGSPEGVETGTGSTAKPQEPGCEATRLEAVDALSAAQEPWREKLVDALVEQTRQRLRAESFEQRVAALEADAAELRFYRQHGFPYVDWSVLFAEPREGDWAIKLPLSYPHPDGEGSCTAVILHAFTVPQLYEKAKAHIAALDAALSPRQPEPGTGA